jgi:plastocyanin
MAEHKEHEIEVAFENGEHVCKPTHTKAKVGDTIFWKGKGKVRFKGSSPFKEGLGPFGPGSRQEATRKGTFPFDGVKGDIIID